MGRKIIVLMFLFLLAGAFFIVKGPSGLVVSQTCCFGSDCLAENKCATNGLGNERQPISVPFSYFAVLFFVLGAAMYIGIHRK